MSNTMNNNMNTMNNEMNKNNNMEGATMMNNTITSKSVKGTKSYRGLKAHDKFRQLQINDLHAHKIVINRVDIVKDRETKEVKEHDYLAVVDYSPLAVAFGLNTEYKQNNVMAYETKDNKKKARRINIDADKYIFTDSIMVIECEDKNITKELADNGYMFKGQLYKALTASPSNEKHAVKYYFKVTEDMNEEEAFNKLDEIMGGSLSDKLMGHGLVSGKDITGANTRIGNYASGMRLLDQIDLNKYRVALVKGSMNQASDFDEATEEMMIAQGIEIDNNINDGASYFSTTVIKRMAATLNMPRLSDKDAMQIAVQARTTVFTGKTLARTLAPETMEEIAKLHNAKFYGNPDGELVALFDTDGAKMVNYKGLENNCTINVYVMAVANASGVKTSSQHLIKYMAVNPEETVRILKDLAKTALDNFVADKIESTNEYDTLTNNRIMAKLPANEVVQDAYLMEAMLADTWKYAQSMIAKNKVVIPGIYTHMMFDMSYNLTAGLVKGILGITKDGFIEAYNPDLMEIYAAEIEAIENDPTLTEEEKEAQLFEIFSAVVVKFPSAMPKEYEIIVYQTKKQLRNKIEAAVSELDITNEEKEIMIDKLVNYFETTPWGCTVYAPVNAMKNKLAGADVDFDATMADMSELKHILINERLNNKGFMGECTFISYKDINRQPKEETTEVVAQEVEDLDIF